MTNNYSIQQRDAKCDHEKINSLNYADNYICNGVH